MPCKGKRQETKFSRSITPTTLHHARLYMLFWWSRIRNRILFLQVAQMNELKRDGRVAPSGAQAAGGVDPLLASGPKLAADEKVLVSFANTQLFRTRPGAEQPQKEGVGALYVTDK